MKQKLLSLTLALFSIGAMAQTQTICFQEKADNLNVDTFMAKDGVTYTNLSLDGAVSLGEVGTPALPKVRHLIALPEDATPTIKIKGYAIQDFTLKELGASTLVAPYQPSLTKNQRPEDVPFVIDNKVYATDEFVQDDIATVTVLGTLRGVQIAQVEINPVNYNPVRGVVRQYSNIDVEVEYDAPTSEISIPAHLQSPYFDVVYKTLSNNDNITRSAADDYPDHPDWTKYPVRMLIVANRMFEEALKPFVEWKTQKGFEVEVAYTNEIGSSASSIRSYIKRRYDNSASEGKVAPTFLVLVGDVEQVAASEQYEWTSDEYFWSDYMYGQMDKDAYERFPEMYYGRLSADTPEQLEAIIDKILYYEKYQFADPSYLGRATIIAGLDPGGLHNYAEIKLLYLTANYLNANYGFTTVNEYGVEDPNNPSSSDTYLGCYDNERFRVGFFTYTAHADQYRFADPLFMSSSVAAIENENQYPLVLGNCCFSADFAFGRDECIGEYFLRKPKGGAVTYIGSSPTSAWNEDRAWTMGAPKQYSGNWWTYENTTMGAYDAPFISDYVSTAGMMFVGNLAVTKYSIIGAIEKYWTGYNVLGDPSLVPYFGEADPINATYSPTIPVGATSFTVAAPSRSLVALSSNGNKLLASALVGTEGNVTLTFDAIQENDKVTLVITKPQHQPVIANLTFGADAIEDITVSSTPTKIEVFNLQGVLVRTVDGEVEFTTDDLAPGTYIIVSTSDVDRKVEKVVVR